jgi:hypothetical protein
MNCSLSESVSPRITELSRKYCDRSIDIFLLDQRMIERQNAKIANAVHAFFSGTNSFHQDVTALARHIDEFRQVYLDMPITRNVYGVNFASGLILFLMARNLNPSLIVESGVYKGQSTYFLASACPRATILAFDPNLRELAYRTPGVDYYEHDWMSSDVKCDPIGTGMCFFDDHQSQAQRIIQAHKRGFRHLVFDDSWPIESVTGCGWPPLPSVDLVISDPLTPGEVVKWVEEGKMWTYIHTEEMQKLCSEARALIKAAYDVPTLYRECAIAPKSALKFVELV